MKGVGHRTLTAGLAAGIGALAFGLRVWGIDFAWGVPRGRPDEELYMLRALQAFGDPGGHGIFEIGLIEGFAMLIHVVLRLYVRTLEAWYGHPVHLGCLFALDPTRVLIASRLLSATLGTLTLVPTALIARRLVAPTRARAVGLSAALVLAVNYLHGRDSHFGVPDAALAFAFAWSLWAVVRLNEDGTWRHAVGAGLAAGLAFAVKWTGLLMMPLLGGSLLAFVWRRRGHRLAAATAMVVSLVAVGLVFLALNPSVVLEPNEAYQGLLSHTFRYATESGGLSQDPRVDLGYGLSFHSRVTLPVAFGWLALGCALFGLSCALSRRTAADWTCVVFIVLVYVIALGPIRMLWLRYCMPVLPVIAALAAAGAVAIAGRAARILGNARAEPYALTILVAAMVVPPVSRLVAIDRVFARTDTRQLAASWLLEHAPDATVVGEVAYTNVYAVDDAVTRACLPALPAALRTRTLRLPATGRDPRDVPLDRAGWGTVAGFALDDYWAANVEMNPDYLTRGFVLLPCGERNPFQWVSPTPDRCLEEVAHFQPGGPPCDATLDLFDQFYVPYAGLRGVERTGPEVVVYRYTCATQTR